MKYVFVLVDTSGSLKKNTQGQINNLLEEVFRELSQQHRLVQSRVIIYAEMAQIHKDFEDKTFLTINKFGGRSNLAEAYNLMGSIIRSYAIDLSRTLIVLLSDGLATDDYRRALMELDPTAASSRLSLELGEEKLTNQYHTWGDPSLSYSDINLFRKKMTQILEDL